ncbi:hypothetical protein GQ53DRAFT_518624 [Thozetella sp. PMI_491]|nr:hypothetical protein GQ53DRAFT_518624 [Thozetella sp. PMI_491]
MHQLSFELLLLGKRPSGEMTAETSAVSRQKQSASWRPPSAGYRLERNLGPSSSLGSRAAIELCSINPEVLFDVLMTTQPSPAPRWLRWALMELYGGALGGGPRSSSPCSPLQQATGDYCGQIPTSTSYGFGYTPVEANVQVTLMHMVVNNTTQPLNPGAL